MKLNEYHKKVLRTALDIFEELGDDSFLDIKYSLKLRNALKELRKASELKNLKCLTTKECLKKLGS